MFKYLKKSVISIIMVLVLLVIQAMCDLALPGYISDIVNIGIQQGGVENVTPKEILLSEMNKLLLFMSEEDKATVLASYEDKQNSSNSEAPAYVLKNAGDETIEALNTIFSVPIVMVSGLSGNTKEASAMQNQLKAAFPEGTLPEDADIFTILSLLPAGKRDEVLSGMRAQFEAYEQLGSNIIQQMGISYVRAEYKAIGIDTDKLQSDYILFAGFKMLGLSLIIVMAAILIALLSSRIAASFGRDLRSGVFRKVVSFSSKEFNEFSTASLITRCTNDIQQIQMLIVMMLRIVFYAPILGIGALFKVFGSNSSMTWVIGVAISAIMSLIVVLLVVAMPKFKALQKLIDKLNLVAREILTGLSVIRAFSREKHEEKRFDDANKELTKANLFVNRVMTIMMPLMMLIMNGVSVLIIWAGADAIDSGSMQVGDLMAFIQYTMQIIMSFLMLSMMSIMLPRAVVSANRVSEVLGTEVSIKDPEKAKHFSEDEKGVIEFQDVYFRYPNAKEDVLQNISFTAKPGQTTAFIGSTGSGKSTLVNLIPRFYDVTGGRILVGGVDIRDVSKHDLRNKIGYVPQKAVLFSGTIESNISYGAKKADKEGIEQAAEIAQAAGFIDEKPDRFESEIAEGGTNVSGGQRQRLSIARAIAMNPEIYIFDDSFSALDYKTDTALRKALKESTKDSTILIVAQRISTVLSADQIIVLDNGEIVGSGTHKELLNSCEVYRQIASSQLSKEEMEA